MVTRAGLRWWSRLVGEAEAGFLISIRVHSMGLDSRKKVSGKAGRDIVNSRNCQEAMEEREMNEVMEEEKWNEARETTVVHSFVVNCSGVSDVKLSCAKPRTVDAASLKISSATKRGLIREGQAPESTEDPTSTCIEEASEDLEVHLLRVLAVDDDEYGTTLGTSL